MAIQVFRSLHDAKAEGFEPYDRGKLVFLVRKKNADKPSGWEIAAVQFTLEPEPNREPHG